MGKLNRKTALVLISSVVLVLTFVLATSPKQVPIEHQTPSAQDCHLLVTTAKYTHEYQKNDDGKMRMIYEIIPSGVHFEYLHAPEPFEDVALYELGKSGTFLRSDEVQILAEKCY